MSGEGFDEQTLIAEMVEAVRTLLNSTHRKVESNNVTAYKIPPNIIRVDVKFYGEG